MLTPTHPTSVFKKIIKLNTSLDAHRSPKSNKAIPRIEEIPKSTKPQIDETPKSYFHYYSVGAATQLRLNPHCRVQPTSLDSVLSSTPKPETVISGKETFDFLGKAIARLESGKGDTRRKKRAGIARISSRSLSELELEEIKGFMDLGFVFSERDRESATLMLIIPGMHRLGGEARTTGVSRSYLSEAWGVVELQRKTREMRWRMREIGNDNESAMKDQLKFWAQAVASAVI